MPVIAKLNYLRIAPRKVHLVANLIRKKKAKEAQTILSFTIKKASNPLLKLLNSAIANARHNFQLDPDNLYISKIIVDEGPKYKRWMPRARGQASPIQKKTSHVTLVLDEISLKAKPEKKKVAKPKAIKRKEARKIKKLEKFEEKISKPKPLKETQPPEGRAGLKPEMKKPSKESLRIPSGRTKPKIVRGIKRIFQRKAF